MALKRNERYPGRFSNPTTNYPQGAFKNRSSPSTRDGSYLEADWANDHDGFFARILNVAGVSPNGVIDNGTSSQLFDALLTALPGRLLNRVVFTSSGTYTPTTGTKKINVTVVGGGGGGGGCKAGNTSDTFCGAGGGAGATSLSVITPVASSYGITVGSGGTGGSGAKAGSNGGNSAFGSLISAGGGTGGLLTSVVSSPGGPGGTATGGQVNISGGGGADGQSASYLISGMGGNSYMGGGGRSGNGGGVAAMSYGGGGGGAYTVDFNLTTYIGGRGANGIVIIEEYS